MIESDLYLKVVLTSIFKFLNHTLTQREIARKETILQTCADSEEKRDRWKTRSDDFTSRPCHRQFSALKEHAEVKKTRVGTRGAPRSLCGNRRGLQSSAASPQPAVRGVIAKKMRQEQNLE